jgi:hypothetical protein
MLEVNEAQEVEEVKEGKKRREPKIRPRLKVAATKAGRGGMVR